MKYFSSRSARHGRREMLRLFSVVFVAATLGACATPAMLMGDGAAFERTGRFAVSVSEPGREPEAIQGGFAWHDAGQVLRLDLANPLGSTLARVRVDAAGAVLERADGTSERASDAEALVAQVLGAPLPVSNLRYWLQGRAGSGAVETLQQDAQGRPLSFAQGGWQLQLSRYDDAGPRLLRLDRRDGARHISVRLVVDAQPAPAATGS